MFIRLLHPWESALMTRLDLLALRCSKFQKGQVPYGLVLGNQSKLIQNCRSHSKGESYFKIEEIETFEIDRSLTPVFLVFDKICEQVDAYIYIYIDFCKIVIIT